MKIGYTTWGMPDLPIDAALTFRTLEGAFARAGIPR